jgi:DNA-binding NarL/FixJ family response regulator
MVQHIPGARSRDQVAKKGQLAHRLLVQGLSIKQIAAQLNCSPYLVRKARESLIQGGTAPER